MSTNIYLNSGNRKFLEDIANTYVDKTELITFTNSVMSTKNKFMCVTRPRRFGKSITADMLCAYYSKGCDSRELFQPYTISTTPFNKQFLYTYVGPDSKWAYRSRERICTHSTTKGQQNLTDFCRNSRPCTRPISGTDLPPLFSRVCFL